MPGDVPDALSVALPPAVPEIPVHALDAAVSYYRDQLGFACDWSDATIGLAGLSRADCRLFLSNADFRSHRGNVGPIVIWLNLESVDDVNALYDAWHTRGARLRSAPETKPFGLHEFYAEDLDGNVLRVFHDVATPARERGA